ncbi:hypothetical protein GGS20DRAFT_560795 [Poronia punctata]|nr:hypothetical protein GGS20DRAFT_560795 [Poronia punctata]
MFRIGSTRTILQGSKAIATPKQPLPILGRLRHAGLNRVPSGIPGQLSLVVRSRLFASKTPGGFQVGIDSEEDKKIAQHKLVSDPAAVSTQSSVRHVYEPSKPEHERPVKEGVKDELKVVRDTFSLATVPKEPYWLGLAGTLPYLGTSVSTVYLAWVINSTHTGFASSSSFINSLAISRESASQLLSTLEPIQLGYGAVIISFLGAVHWGMEYTEKISNPARTRFRYGLGVMSSVVAWPTLLLPVEFALISQFAAFVGLYFADARATVRGWAPAWYSNYRFALTAVVGVALAISLIGRAKVGDASPRLSGLSEKFHQTHGEESYNQKWQGLEEDERQKLKKEKEEAEKKKKEEEEKAKAEEKKKKPKNSDKEKKGGEDEGKK